MVKPTVIGAIAIIVASSLWGIDQVVIRPNLFHIENVAVIVFIEHIMAFVLMGFVCLHGIKEVRKLNRKDWASFFWVSLFGGAIGTMAIVQALILVQFHQLSIVALLQKLQPVFAIIAAIFLLKEMPKRIFYFWAALALIGSYFVTFGFEKPVFAGNEVFLSALYAILAAFAFGSSTSFGKYALQKVSYKTGAYIRFGMTSVIMFLVILLTGSFGFFGKVAMQDIGFFLVIVFTSGAVAMFIYYYGLKRVMASQSTIYELAYPATAILLDFILNGKVFSVGQWLGTAILIFSIYRIAGLGSEKKGGRNKTA